MFGRIPGIFLPPFSSSCSCIFICPCSAEKARPSSFSFSRSRERATNPPNIHRPHFTPRREKRRRYRTAHSPIQINSRSPYARCAGNHTTPCRNGLDSTTRSAAARQTGLPAAEPILGDDVAGGGGGLGILQESLGRECENEVSFISNWSGGATGFGITDAWEVALPPAHIVFVSKAVISRDETCGILENACCGCEGSGSGCRASRWPSAVPQQQQQSNRHLSMT